MRTTSTAGRLAACGLAAALAGLLLTAFAETASAAEGVARASDKATGVVQTGHSEACATTCSTDGGCSTCCPPGCKGGDGCKCGGCKRGFLGRLFGKGCCCDKRCGSLCDLNGDGVPDPIGTGICRECGAHGDLYGHGYCGSCCGHGICLPGIPVPCCLGIPIPCFGGGCVGRGGALGGCYGRVYALNPHHHDFRDGAVYAAQGYNAPIAVPLAPNVDYQWNYGWGIPSSRLTPVSRVVPSPYAVPPTFAVPPGYVPAGAEAAAADTDGSVPPPPAPAE